MGTVSYVHETLTQFLCFLKRDLPVSNRCVFDTDGSCHQSVHLRVYGIVRAKTEEKDHLKLKDLQKDFQVLEAN